MRLRWKLLILLLVIALIPLIVATTLTRQRMRQLGTDIGQQRAEALVQDVRDQLAAFVADRAVLLQQSVQNVDLAIRVQADAANRCLAEKNPPPADVIFYEEIKAGRVGDVKLDTSPRYYTVSPDGARATLPFSLKRSVIKLAPGVARDTVTDEINRLGLLTPTYRHLYGAAGEERQRELSFWHYTALENGVYNCYPGHGGYPPDYDGRKRDWYKATRSAFGRKGPGMEPVWTVPPYVDVSSGQVVVTVSLPVCRPDGSFGGVTALDVAVADLARHGAFVSVPGSSGKVVVWSARDRLEQVVAKQDDDFGLLSPEERDRLGRDLDNVGMLVVAEPGSQTVKARMEHTWLESDDPAFDEMKRDVLDRRSAVRLIHYDGEPCLWGYGPILRQACLVVIVPYDEILQQARDAEQRIQAATRAQWIRSGIILAVACVIVIAVALFGSRAVTQPLHSLVGAADRIARGDFSAQVDVRSHDELGELGQTFNDMMPKLQERVHMEQSLSVAQEVQQSLLPSAPPTVPGLDVASRCIYCDETGGDYLDFIDLSGVKPNTLGTALGDVTGHGVGAALLMASGGALLRGGAEELLGLGDLLNHLNKHLLRRGAGRRKFMTLSYVVFDGPTGDVRWASAGHDPPIVFDPASGEFSELKGAGIPLGIDAEWKYEEYGPRALAPGQVIVIGTDGIWEARNDQHDLFEKRRLRDVIAASHARTADQICEDITAAVVEFRAGHPQEDDITFIVIKVVK